MLCRVLFPKWAKPVKDSFGQDGQGEMKIVSGREGRNFNHLSFQADAELYTKWRSDFFGFFPTGLRSYF